MREEIWRRVFEEYRADPPAGWRKDKPWEWTIRHTAYGREAPAPRDKWWARATEFLWLPRAPQSGATDPRGLGRDAALGALQIPHPSTSPYLSGQAAAAAAGGFLALADRPGPGKGGKGGKDKNGKQGKGKGNKNGNGRNGKGNQGGREGCSICGSPKHLSANCPILQQEKAEASDASTTGRPTKKTKKEKAAARAAAKAAGGRPTRRGNRRNGGQEHF